jgi:hypothetical protein
MSRKAVVEFLAMLADAPTLLAQLNTASKDEVVALARESGYEFYDADYDDVVWNLEARLAERRGERFDNTFSLWELMWGRYYLEFVVRDVIPSFTPAELAAALGAAVPS